MINWLKHRCGNWERTVQWADIHMGMEKEKKKWFVIKVQGMKHQLWGHLPHIHSTRVSVVYQVTVTPELSLLLSAYVGELLLSDMEAVAGGPDCTAGEWPDGLTVASELGSASGSCWDAVAGKEQNKMREGRLNISLWLLSAHTNTHTHTHTQYFVVITWQNGEIPKTWNGILMRKLLLKYFSLRYIPEPSAAFKSHLINVNKQHYSRLWMKSV